MIFLDIETDADRLVCVGWAIDDEPVQSSPSLPDAVRARLADVDEVVVTHSGYDVRFLHFQEGVDVQAQMHDTQVMAWLVNENTTLDLAGCALRYLGVTLDKTLQKQAGTAPYADVAAYCEKDVTTTRDLYKKLKERIEGDGLWDYFDTTEAPFTATLRNMEFAGLPVDLAEAEKLADAYRIEAERLKQKLTTGMPASFNIRSPQHVSKYLGSAKFTVAGKVAVEVGEMEKTLAALAGVNPTDTGEEFETNWDDVPVGTFVTTKHGRKWDHGFWVVGGMGQGAMDTSRAGGVARPELMDDLRLSQDPWVKDYLDYKKMDKMLGTYLDTFPIRARNGRLYGRFNQTGTTTGRLSSSEPNLQNIPSRGKEGQQVRELFRGNLVVGDFSQLEPRLMAHFSQDPYMIEAFRAGRDLYEEIAARVGCSRGVAKTLVLAMSYGAGADKVARTLRLNGYPTTAQAAANLIKKLQAEYTVYFAWREKVIAESRRTGSVSTIDGRLRRLQFQQTRGDAGAWKDPSAPGRQAANAIVQGSAADVVRRVMLHTTRMFPQLTLLAQVHDELVWEYDPATYTPDLNHLEKWVLGIAQRGISVPLVFEPHTGSSWYRAKEGI